MIVVKRSGDIIQKLDLILEYISTLSMVNLKFEIN